MTPSNDPNGNPLIYRIADALGITHLVVAVQHSHLMSEITGLLDALAAKANAAAVETALAGKANVNHQHAGVSNGNNGWVEVTNDGQAQVVGNQSVLIGIGDNDAAIVTLANIGNLKRALDGPDSEPTESSDNLITSGGVSAALAAKADKVSGATNNNFAALDSNGNIKDSGYKAANFASLNHAHSEIVDYGGIVECSSEGVAIGATGGKVSIEIGNSEAAINSSNIANLIRALSDPDDYPYRESDKLVTSGGVAAALAEIEYSESGTPIDLDILFGDKSIIKKKVIGIRNIQLQDISIKSRLYSESGVFVEFANNIGDIPAEGIVIVTVYWMSSAYFVTLNGIFE